LFRTIAITTVVTFVLIASTLLLDNLLDRTSIDRGQGISRSCFHGETGATGTQGDEPGRVSEADHIGGDSGPEIGDIAPGQTKVLTVTLAAGGYTAMCNLPGHYAAGMHFQFTVA
jgi:hypothetical protein